MKSWTPADFSRDPCSSKQNEWGGTIGGPVVIPKVYNGGDRTFWFFSFDQFYSRGGSPRRSEHAAYGQDGPRRFQRVSADDL